MEKCAKANCEDDAIEYAGGLCERHNGEWRLRYHTWRVSEWPGNFWKLSDEDVERYKTEADERWEKYLDE